VNDLSDQQLLSEYAENRREAAFAELVRRHVDLVHSAALRLLRDPHLAQDVTQAVFAALAENARRLARHPVLSGWLHCTARNLAAKAIRADARRHAREQEAAAMTETPSDPSDHAWTAIAPHLDLALGELNAADREAVLLRYFEKKSAAEMAGTLGITDEAAQKRVNRAIERLRGLFAKRGVSLGVAGVGTAIAANAVQAAPAGFAAAISTAVLAGTAVTASTTIAITQTIAMSTLQKVILGGALAATLGTGLFEARQAAQLRSENEALAQQQEPLRRQIQALQSQLAAATNRLAELLAENPASRPPATQTELLKLRAEVARLRQNDTKPPGSDTRSTIAKSWLERENQLRQLVKLHPDKAIPEFSLLSEEDWMSAARDAQFSTDTEVRHTLANLRRAGEGAFATLAHTAVAKYSAANDGRFPTSLSDLAPYFEQPVDAAILDRWQILPQSALPNQHMGGDFVITEKGPVDADLDNRYAIGSGGYGSAGGANLWDADVNAAIAILAPVDKAYAADHNGQEPTDPSQIVPYLTTPDQKAAFEKWLQTYGTNQVKL
jgi:RNA polymerase sigma factor (sigma-70 family)